MLARIFVLLVFLPLVELVILVWIASKTSVVLVVALVIGTGILGSWLLRRHGFRAFGRVSQELERGEVPGDSLFDGLLIALAAGLLILPGVLSDVVAIGLLFPPSRRAIKSFLRRRFESRIATRHAFAEQARFDHDRIIDVKVIESPPGKQPS